MTIRNPKYSVVSNSGSHVTNSFHTHQLGAALDELGAETYEMIKSNAVLDTKAGHRVNRQALESSGRESVTIRLYGSSVTLTVRD